MTIALYARRKRWPLDEVVVRLRHSRVHAEDCADCETKAGMLDVIEREISLNGDPAIHVNMPDAAGGKLRHDVGRSPRHALHHSPEGGGGQRASAEHENGLLTIRPGVKGQDRLEGLAANDKRIHRGHELIVAVGFATAQR